MFLRTAKNASAVHAAPQVLPAAEGGRSGRMIKGIVVMKKQNAGKGKARKKGSPLFLLVIALFLLISALVLLRFSGFGAAPGSDSFKSMVDNTELMQYAKGVKQDIKDLEDSFRLHYTPEDGFRVKKCKKESKIAVSFQKSHQWCKSGS